MGVRVVRGVVFGVVALLTLGAAPAVTAAPSSGATPTSRNLVVAGVSLSKWTNRTVLDLRWEGRSDRRFLVSFTDPRGVVTAAAVVTSRARCWRSWCAMKEKVTMPATVTVAAMTVTTLSPLNRPGVQTTLDLLSRPVVDPYQLAVLAKVGLANATLIRCAKGNDWTRWPATPADRTVLSEAFKSANRLNKVLVATVALNATNQEWQAIQPERVGEVLPFVPDRLKDRLSDTVNVARDIWGYDWEAFLPDPQQLQDIGKQFALGAAGEKICRNHGL